MQKTAKEIVETLKKHGFISYLAGGCVRDILLKVEPKDYDIVTSATPDEIEKIFDKTYAVGKAFGVIHINKNGHTFEIATFRQDLEYKDKRRPSGVVFSDAKEDALRRDFTINALYLDPTTNEIIDYVEGQKDLKEKLIRFVGDPEKRVSEDSLRLLRGVRMAHQIQGQYHPDTYKAISKYAHEIVHVSKERIQDEMNKILKLPNRDKALEDLREIGLLKHIIPELEKTKGLPQPHIYHQEGDVWTHTLQSIKSLGKKPSLELIWATMLHDIGKPETYSYDDDRIKFNKHAEIGGEITKTILKRLKFGTKFTNDVSWLVSHHMMFDAFFKMKKHKKIMWATHPLFPKLLAVNKADSMGTTPPRLEIYKKAKTMRSKILKDIPRNKLPKPFLSGSEIMKITKIEEGKKIGKLKQQIYNLQLEGKIKTKKEAKDILINKYGRTRK